MARVISRRVPECVSHCQLAVALIEWSRDMGTSSTSISFAESAHLLCTALLAKYTSCLFVRRSTYIVDVFDQTAKDPTLLPRSNRSFGPIGPLPDETNRLW